MSILKNIMTDAKPYAQFFIALFVILVSLVIFSLLSIITAMLFWNTDFQTVLSAASSPTGELLAITKYMQIISSIGVFVVPAVILAKLYKGSVNQVLGIKTIPKKTSFLFVFIIAFFSMPIINMLVEINSYFSLPESLAWLEEAILETEEQQKILTEALLITDSVNNLLVNVLMIAILPAIGEELLFRGILQPIFIRWTKSPHIGIFTTAALFSAIHFQLYGFLPRLYLGIIFGYYVYWSRSIWLPVLAHFINNLIAVIAYYTFSLTINRGIEQVGTDASTITWLLISLGLVGFLLKTIHQIETKPKTTQKQMGMFN